VPTYEYACPSCDTRHEIVQSMSEPALTICPNCGKDTLRKLFTNVGVVFKGSGFYRNDSRSTEKQPSSSTEVATPSTTSKEISKPAETPKKTETKSETKKPATPTAS
jgi:putative FmdB family regulatory protein